MSMLVSRMIVGIWRYMYVYITIHVLFPDTTSYMCISIFPHRCLDKFGYDSHRQLPPGTLSDQNSYPNNPISFMFEILETGTSFDFAVFWGPSETGTSQIWKKYENSPDIPRTGVQSPVPVTQTLQALESLSMTCDSVPCPSYESLKICLGHEKTGFFNVLSNHCLRWDSQKVVSDWCVLEPIFGLDKSNLWTTFVNGSVNQAKGLKMDVRPWLPIPPKFTDFSMIIH